MTPVRVHNFTISLDGYGAGPRQTREEPLGARGEKLHEWLFRRARSTAVRQPRWKAVRSSTSSRAAFAIAPRLLGSGEHLMHGLDLTALGYECTAHAPTAGATHAVLTKRQ